MEVRKEERPFLPPVRRILVYAQSRIRAFIDAENTLAPAEIVEQRERLCRACPNLRVNKKKQFWCSVCGCFLTNKYGDTRNLAAYVELFIAGQPLPERGCKHPDRLKGKGWPLVEGGYIVET